MESGKSGWSYGAAGEGFFFWRLVAESLADEYNV